MGLFDRDKSAERLPVSLVTGFLGSGKTTLVNRLLRRPGMADTAVLVNEFGDIALDHLLVEAVAGEVVLLASGCICCAVRSDVETTLRDLLARRDRGEVPPFSRVLVETTGLADPAPLVQLLLANPLLLHAVRLDAVIATLDAAHGAMQLDRHREAVKQVAIADRIVLTKRDLVSADGEAALVARVRRLNAAAPVIAVDHGEVDPDRLFGAGLHRPDRPIPDVARWLALDAHAAAAGLPRHAADVGAVCLTAASPLAWEHLSSWLQRLRAERGPDLMRIKGVFDVVGEAAPLVVHGVHHVLHPPTLLAGWPDGPRRSAVVLIGRNLDRDAIAAGWNELAAGRCPT
ncbi:GTP-binding protein [Stella sp.]|uniref:CobW family GTP-binding protein n=1 Tax=Stella sp. TaxID=2912054 RepID=UPI0035B39CD9